MELTPVAQDATSMMGNSLSRTKSLSLIVSRDVRVRSSILSKITFCFNRGFKYACITKLRDAEYCMGHLRQRTALPSSECNLRLPSLSFSDCCCPLGAINSASFSTGPNPPSVSGGAAGTSGGRAGCILGEPGCVPLCAAQSPVRRSSRGCRPSQPRHTALLCAEEGHGTAFLVYEEFSVHFSRGG